MFFKPFGFEFEFIFVNFLFNNYVVIAYIGTKCFMLLL